MRLTAQTCVFMMVFAALVTPAHAQQPVENVLVFLLTNRAVKTDDFVADAEAVRTTADTITRLLQAELTTLPLTSSSPGFNYRFNPALGTLERTSPGFGPFFTERSITAGRYDVSLGMTFQVASYTSLDHHNLRDGTFVTTATRLHDETEPFDIETLTLRMTSRTMTLWGTVGITDRFDLGFAAPFISLSMQGSRVNTYRGQRLLQATANAAASGFGDVTLRSKLRVVGRRPASLAMIGEFRLPTGRSEDLLGAGRASVRGLVSGSIEAGSIALDANGGVATGGLSNEVNYRAAIAISRASRLTLVGEIVGRRLVNVGGIEEVSAAHPTLRNVDTIRLVPDGEATHAAVLVAGAKWNVFGMWVLNASVSVPLTSEGLRSVVTPAIGFNYAFP